jgi:dihydroorotate dehydrogenase
MSLAFSLARPLLHRLDAERAHGLTIAALKHGPRLGSGPVTSAKLQRQVFGITFPNPVGLAAGFDKNAEVPDAMLAQGFGFVEVGTVTPLPQDGNARPRLFRLTEDSAIINRMGFNNLGHAAVLQRLIARQGKSGIVGVNIGANKDSADRIADYVRGVEVFQDVAGYITINVSSPNTPGLRNLQARADLEALLQGVNKARRAKVPLLLKIAPDLGPQDLEDIAAACSGGAVDGVIISNTTISRPGLRSAAAREAGGLSGAPLFDLATRTLRLFSDMTAGKLPLIGVGGISSPETAQAKFAAGASLIQIYSALVYQGPALVHEICNSLERA